MTRFPKYKNYYVDNYRSEKPESPQKDNYNEETRHGLDDPLPMSSVDLKLRMDMLHVAMIGYDIPAYDFIRFLEMLYPPELISQYPK